METLAVLILMTAYVVVFTFLVVGGYLAIKAFKAD